MFLFFHRVLFRLFQNRDEMRRRLEEEKIARRKQEVEEKRARERRVGLVLKIFLVFF